MAQRIELAPGILVSVFPDAESAGAAAALEVIDRIQRCDNDSPLLGLATGSSPESLYRALVSAPDHSWRERLEYAALDEYLGLPEGHPESYREFLLEHLIRPLGIDPALLVTLNPHTDSPEQQAQDYEEFIADRQGIDVQILGIGTNGHIAFNEPGSSFDSRTRIAPLSDSTRQDNSRFFDSLEQVPTHSLTQGIGTILDARALVMVVFGEHKASAIADALLGPVTEEVPASALRQHQALSVYLDDAAAVELLKRWDANA